LWVKDFFPLINTYTLNTHFFHSEKKRERERLPISSIAWGERGGEDNTANGLQTKSSFVFLFHADIFCLSWFDGKKLLHTRLVLNANETKWGLKNL
jgi:hypothetical protein